MYTVCSRVAGDDNRCCIMFKKCGVSGYVSRLRSNTVGNCLREINVFMGTEILFICILNRRTKTEAISLGKPFKYY